METLRLSLEKRMGILFLLYKTSAVTGQIKCLKQHKIQAYVFLKKKIRDAKGKFHAEMGTTKDRSGRDLTEAEDIKRWQEYTE